MSQKLTYQPLNQSQTKLLISCMFAEKDGNPGPPESEYTFLMQIVQKRIQAMNLPIKFTPWALALIQVMAPNPGKAVVFLIDALDKFEGQTVNVEMICQDLYPWGFYDDTSFTYVVDEIHKNLAHKWSFVYGVTHDGVTQSAASATL